MSDVMLTNDVALYLGVSAETVRQWERTGKLAAARTPTGVRLFRRTDVEALKKARESR